MFDDNDGDVLMMNIRKSTVFNAPNMTITQARQSVPIAYILICHLPEQIDGQKARRVLWNIIKKR